MKIWKKNQLKKRKKNSFLSRFAPTPAGVLQPAIKVCLKAVLSDSMCSGNEGASRWLGTIISVHFFWCCSVCVRLCSLYFFIFFVCPWVSLSVNERKTILVTWVAESKSPPLDLQTDKKTVSQVWRRKERKILDRNFCHGVLDDCGRSWSSAR